MKSILLASVSAFAFAGAAAAEVTLSGSADAMYNTMYGFSSSATLDFSASAELNNGWTATTSFSSSFDPFGDTSEIEWSGNISLTDGTSTLAFGSFDNHAAYEVMGGAQNDYQSIWWSDANFDGFMGSTTFGDVGLTVTVSDSGLVVGAASMSLGGADVTVGMASDGVYGLGLSTSAGGVDIDFQTVGGAWGLGVGYTMGSIALGFNTGDTAEWDITADYSADPLSVGVTYDNYGSWSVTAGYDMGSVSAEAKFADGAFTGASLSYTEGAISATLSTDGMGVEVEGSYDMGNGAVVMAGMVADGTYVGLEYDFGNGASATVSYSTGDINPDNYAVGYLEGGSVGVSFEF